MQPRSVARSRSGGRPSKGDRKDVRARPERATAELIDDLSYNAGIPITEFSAALLEIGLLHLNELPAHLQPKEVLPEAG
jgi:hypothetical protein